MNRAIFFITLIYFIFENWYFGWNWTAQSDAEMTCDMLGGLMIAIGIFAHIVERNQNANRKP